MRRGAPTLNGAVVSGARSCPSGRDAQSRDTADSGAGRRWHGIDWQSSFWALFLGIPLVNVAQADGPLAVRVGVCAAILAFAVLYVRTVSVQPVWADLPVGASLWRQLRPVAGALAGLTVLAAVCLPFVTWWGPYYLPYLAGVVLFATTLTTGIALVAAACVVTVLLPVLAGAPVEAVWIAAGCSMSCLSIAIGRIGAEVSERRRTADRELVAAREREEISRDVHDILGHSLTVLTLKAEVAQRLVAVDPQRAEAELGEIVELSRAALTDVRSTVTRLRTPDLAGQIEATTTACDAAQIELTLRGRARDVPLPQREIVSWALREATTNLLRHAGARRVVVELGPGLLRVTDDGVGLGATAPGNGLTGLRERVEAAGGVLSLVSPAPDGVLARPTGPGTQLEVVL